MYSVLISDIEVLQQRVDNACWDIQLNPGIFDGVCISVQQKAESCVEVHGSHIDHMNIAHISAGIGFWTCV
jgi:hypothetical protein